MEMGGTGKARENGRGNSRLPFMKIRFNSMAYLGGSAIRVLRTRDSASPNYFGFALIGE